MQDQPTVPTPPPVGTRSGAPSLLWKAPSVEELQAKLPQYEVLEILGCGGMGAVYKARQKSLKRLVAIKILPLGMADDEFQFVERFQNEAQTMAQMNHPAIVNVYDFGETADGLLYYVMEFVDGTDVQKMIQASGRLRSEHALSITAHVCDAIAYAHKRGVIHRDIKPANILIDQEGHIKVADFGLAKMHDPAEISGLTKTNMAMGTPDYVAPEVLVTGMVADHRADLYAVGVMLYQMLTGEVPRGMFKLPSQKGIGADPRFDEIICKAMEQDREDRYQSATEVRLALDAILTTPMPKNDGTGVIPVSTVQQSVETQKASGKSKQFVVVAVVAVLAIGGWFASGGMGKPSTSTTNGVGKADTAFLAEVAAATPERQVELVEERIYSLNKVPVKLKPRIEKGKVIELFSGLVDEAPVPDLSPIAALRDLRILNIDTRGASDLAWLRGMNLDTFACEHGAFTDIKPLAELPLKFLILKNGAECDYSVLAGLKLRSFTVVNSPVRDISFLKESPLNTLMLRNTGLTDWSPIRNMPLHEISGDLVPERDADILRSIPTLKIINSEPAAEFFSSLGGTSPPPAAAQGKTVDLLALVDVRRDAVLGDWVRTAEGLSKPAASNPAGNEAPNLQLPYEPLPSLILKSNSPRVAGPVQSGRSSGHNPARSVGFSLGEALNSQRWVSNCSTPSQPAVLRRFPNRCSSQWKMVVAIAHASKCAVAHYVVISMTSSLLIGAGVLSASGARWQWVRAAISGFAPPARSFSTRFSCVRSAARGRLMPFLLQVIPRQRSTAGRT